MDAHSMPWQPEKAIRYGIYIAAAHTERPFAEKRLRIGFPPLSSAAAILPYRSVGAKQRGRG
jgi:hypothetical protein